MYYICIVSKGALPYFDSFISKQPAVAGYKFNLMYFTFRISDKAKQNYFIANGTYPESVKTEEVDFSKLTKEERANIAPYVTSKGVDASGFTVAETEGLTPSAFNYNRMQHWEADTFNALEALKLFALEASPKVQRERLIKREAFYMQNELYKAGYKDNLLLNQNQVKVYNYWEGLNKIKKAELEENLPSTSVVIASARKYDFNISLYWRSFHKEINQAIVERSKKAAERKAAIAEQLFTNLEEWALANGSELLKSRIENSFNWKALAMTEQAKHIAKEVGLYSEGVYDAESLEDDHETGAPSLEIMKAINAFQAKAKPFSYLSLHPRRAYIHGSAEKEDYLNVTGQIGTVKIDLVFTV